METRIAKVNNEVRTTDIVEQAQLTFNTFREKLESRTGEIAKILEKDVTPESCDEAKALAKEIAKIRKFLDEAHGEIKSDLLKKTKGIDKARKAIKDEILDTEAQLKDYYTYFEQVEAEKKRKLAFEREQQLIKFGWVNSSGKDLGVETEMDFQDLLEANKARFLREQKELEAKEAERAKLFLENERLKAEANLARAKQEEKDRKAQEAQKLIDDELKAKRADIDAREKALADAGRLEQDDKVKLLNAIKVIVASEKDEMSPVVKAWFNAVIERRGL